MGVLWFTFPLGNSIVLITGFSRSITRIDIMNTWSNIPSMRFFLTKEKQKDYSDNLQNFRKGRFFSQQGVTSPRLLPYLWQQCFLNKGKCLITTQYDLLSRNTTPHQNWKASTHAQKLECYHPLKVPSSSWALSYSYQLHFIHAFLTLILGI